MSSTKPSPNRAPGKWIVVQTGTTSIQAVQAFVPDPLPPDLTWDDELVSLLADANHSLGELAGIGRRLANPHLLIRPFVRREAVLSSRIEGTQADAADLYAFEAEQRQRPLPGFEPEVPRSDVREVSNYVGALEYGVERLKTLPVSLRLIRELHQRLLAGDRGRHRDPGQFRRHQNWIGPLGSKLETSRYVPPPVSAMEEGMAALESYLHRDRPQHPQLIRLALVHYQFEAIHPFIDGNGRIGRLLLILLLVSWDLLPHPLLYLSAYFERHRSAYYELLLDVSRRGAWREWIAFFLRGVAEESRDSVLLAQRLQDLQENWHQKMAVPGASALALRLVDSLFESPILTIPMAAGRLGVTYPTAKNHVEALERTGILSLVQGTTYPKVYLAREVIDLTQGEPRRD